MKWQKLGLVFCPAGEYPWMQSHAAGPIAEPLGGDLFRVYFSPRDGEGRSQIVSLDMQVTPAGGVVLPGSFRHVLSHGRNGFFDDRGVSVGALLRQGSRRLLYYLGWNLSGTIPYRTAIGVAVAEDDGDGSFTRLSVAPIVDRSEVDPITIAYPYLLEDEGRYRIWYSSAISWDQPTTTGYHVDLKYAESDDGLHWRREGEVALACDFPQEYAISRPHVIRDPDVYRMWYSFKKGQDYRLGYAESDDGRQWRRLDDQAGLAPSAEGWDSEIVAYPCVFDHGGRRYMLYSGNGYGREGFGLAVLSEA